MISQLSLNLALTVTLEAEIRDEKCEELRETGFIELADPRNFYASCPTMPAKKDEQGEWRERRFRRRL